MKTLSATEKQIALGELETHKKELSVLLKLHYQNGKLKLHVGLLRLDRLWQGEVMGEELFDQTVWEGSGPC